MKIFASWRRVFTVVLPVILMGLAACSRNNGEVSTLPFDTVPQVRPLVPVVNEISGIADSKLNSGFIWGHEDSGNPPQLYLIGHDGVLQKKIFLQGITNRDWEDMALSGNEIYIGETGDNSLSFSEYRFYRFPEPLAAADTVHNIDVIRFVYPDGAHDAEAFIVDAQTKDIYIITKRDQPSKIYKLAFPYSTTALNTATPAGSLGYSGVVGAAVSPDGKELLVKTYTQIFHYSISAGNSIPQALQSVPGTLPYNAEPQGEALGFAADNGGFYTLSEKGFAANVNLYFYKRR